MRILEVALIELPMKLSVRPHDSHWVEHVQFPEIAPKRDAIASLTPGGECVTMYPCTGLNNLYVGMTDVTAKGLTMVPKKDRMQMMRTGRGALTPKQLDEVMQMYPNTQIFDPSGYWTPERTRAAMKELGKDAPMPKK